jgi:HAD superfamily hydrolase (TIGR01509 family)
VNIDLVIFDCDGVLVDSELLSNQSDLDLLESLGIKLELEDYMRRYVGKSALDTMTGIEAQTGMTLPEDFLTRKQARVLEYFERGLQPIPNISSVFKDLPYPRCVASSSTPERILFSLSQTGLLEYFEPHTIFSATMVKNGKPAPDLFLLAAREMKVSPARCVVIEDSISGVLGAVAAGMTAFGFTGGSHIRAGHTERLLQAGATRVFTDMTELPALIGST